LRRLEAEPAVAGVAYATHFGDGHGHDIIEIDSAGRPAGADTAGNSRAQWVGVNRVATNFFSVLDVPMVAGRAFTRADALDGSMSVIVDRRFIERFLGEGSPLGRRLRFIDDPRTAGTEPGPWLEIVGVVSDFMTGGEDFQPPGIYRATTLDQLSAPLASPSGSAARRQRRSRPDCGRSQPPSIRRSDSSGWERRPRWSASGGASWTSSHSGSSS
jgi:hypothetical protein